MEHIEAMRTKAAERYLLGEMTDSEAESFEEHYFDCSVCANDVRDEMRVLEWGRELLRQERMPANVVPIDRRRWRDWVPLAAAAILVVGIGLPMLRKSDREGVAEAGKLHTLQVGVNRGRSEPVTLAKGQWLVLTVDFATGDAVYSRYEVAVRDARGQMRRRSLNREEIERGEATVVLRELPAGTGEATIEGVRKDGNRTEIVRQSFNVQY